jgi:hypothetical protein
LIGTKSGLFSGTCELDWPQIVSSHSGCYRRHCGSVLLSLSLPPSLPPLPTPSLSLFAPSPLPPSLARSLTHPALLFNYNPVSVQCDHARFCKRLPIYTLVCTKPYPTYGPQCPASQNCFPATHRNSSHSTEITPKPAYSNNPRTATQKAIAQNVDARCKPLR